MKRIIHIDYYKNKNDDIFRVNHTTKEVHMWSVFNKKWDACWTSVYAEIVHPGMISKLFLKYRKIEDKEAFIELL